ncbi:flavin-nucleotide-binding protein [Paenibacillus selenitireducens]|uniref:Flavin-nucleotide-binding protein n=1 Tax=Paenibacillus selenitireducens TaxID=1324314 RepID=A0A1T2XJV9_9BACL|nr:pyridoxamine 5'-phosphate oxidase family protein [Paenibacillus selenitireducens]OPA80150.1 flavin-nucleotide-binding protein [Paenibacillus selenitireducens]
MRRKEFSIEEQQEIELFLAEMTFGFLGTLSEDGWPHITPLNFVYHEGDIYFHGSKIGDKMKQMKHDTRVTFSVAKEFALIPSYFTDPTYACPATAFFKSVLLKGTAHLVDDPSLKARVFTAFMQKLQPEGGYEPFNLEDPGYLRQINGVAMVRIQVESMSAKFKFGQNASESKRDQIVAGLSERQALYDEETIEMMKKYCPHHR